MERIKFRIKRNKLGFFWYLFINEFFPVGLIAGGLFGAILNRDVELLYITAIPMLPLFFWLWRRSTVIINGNKMIIRFGIVYYHIVVDVSTVSDVHYKRKKEAIIGPYRRSMKLPFQNSKELEYCCVNVPFQKPEETVCFTSARGNHYYLAVKEHEKLYELLKKREVYPEAE